MHRNTTTGLRFRCDWDTQKALPPVRRRFGYTDKKGREFGAIGYTGTIEVEAVPEGSIGYYPKLKRAGLHHYFSPSAARDGKLYGATQPFQFFDTPEERDAAMERYFKGAERRAANHKHRSVR